MIVLLTIPLDFPVAVLVIGFPGINSDAQLSTVGCRREGGRYDHEPIDIYSGAQIVFKIYSEPL